MDCTLLGARADMRESAGCLPSRTRLYSRGAVVENFLGFYCANLPSTSRSKHGSTRFHGISIVSSKSYCEFQTIAHLVLDYFSGMNIPAVHTIESIRDAFPFD
mgnify:CR=1 FL=1